MFHGGQGVLHASCGSELLVRGWWVVVEAFIHFIFLSANVLKF